MYYSSVGESWQTCQTLHVYPITHNFGWATQTEPPSPSDQTGKEVFLKKQDHLQKALDISNHIYWFLVHRTQLHGHNVHRGLKGDGMKGQDTE